ncbi:uncharacterized protein LOC131651303 [Vicia villosa]|uniref:uncharacterized protein LOC131651303 n=1 Tax=Vicia villosa TaxID=3911 RepID=UPI00273BD407|nr:uncharacterized protein LOC131651303 [Vicia villosa]
MELVDIPCVGGDSLGTRGTPFVIEEWAKIKVEGRGEFILNEKLKRLKGCIKEWNRDTFAWIDLKVYEHGNRLHKLDSLLVDNHGGDGESFVKDRKIDTGDIWDKLNLKKDIPRLKSRQLWLKEGDRNSRFFHNSLKERYRRNTISSVEVEDGRVEGVEDIKEAIESHFEEFFRERNCNRYVPAGNKSVGPDGFSLKFYKQNWDLIKNDVLRFLSDFHKFPKLTKACTSSFLTLIPKINNPQSLTDYRLICLMGSMYKIFSKLLASRLKCVLGKIFSNNQTTFVLRRNIADGILMINEILDLAKREKRSSVVLKVDFEKAYDSVSWNFLRYFLPKTRFGD